MSTLHPYDATDNKKISYGCWNNMYPQKIDAIQSNSLSKVFLDSKNSRVNYYILIFVEKLYLADPYDKMLTISSLE